MSTQALIDLYVPGRELEPEAVVGAAREAGLDAVIYVRHTPEELPDPDQIDALRGDDGPYLHSACSVLVEEGRFAVLLPDWEAATEGAGFDVIETLLDARTLHAAVRELGGVALPVCLRQDADGEVLRQVKPLPAEIGTGVVAMVAGGSLMARDLELEDAGIQGRRVLASTGPFGTLEDIGRYATLLRADPRDVTTLISALGDGGGLAIELKTRSSQQNHGGGDDGGPQGKRKRKRRRRRRKSGGSGGEG